MIPHTPLEEVPLGECGFIIDRTLKVPTSEIPSGKRKGLFSVFGGSLWRRSGKSPIGPSFISLQKTLSQPMPISRSVFGWYSLREVNGTSLFPFHRLIIILEQNISVGLYHVTDRGPIPIGGGAVYVGSAPLHYLAVPSQYHSLWLV